jgi:hypothetical protein
MRTRQLHARMHVFVSTFKSYWYSDIYMFVDDAPLKNVTKNAPVFWAFCRGFLQPARRPCEKSPACAYTL